MSRGRVLDRQHDARIGKGAAAREQIQAALFELVQAGRFRPSMGELEGRAAIPSSTIKNYFPRLPELGGVLAARVPLLVVRALNLDSLKAEHLSALDQHRIAHAVLVGERYTPPTSRTTGGTRT